MLDAALREYAGKSESPELGLVMLGQKVEAQSARAGRLKVHYLDFVSEEARLAALYSAVDVVALPSREENLSNMLAEALCCGTPCLAFGIGGNGDLISHQSNGYLAAGVRYGRHGFRLELDPGQPARRQTGVDRESSARQGLLRSSRAGFPQDLPGCVEMTGDCGPEHGPQCFL